MTSSASGTLRLYVWGTHPTLPTLDPTSLYAACLLQHSFSLDRSDSEYTLQLVAAEPSTPAVPLLQVLKPDGSQQRLTTLDEIRAFCIAQSGLDAALDDDPKRAAKATALHALLDDELLDITLHSLFSFPDNFRAVTAPSYASGSTSYLSRSVPNRLRGLVQARLAGTLWGVGGREATTQRQEADALAKRANILPQGKKGLDAEMKDKVRDEFERGRLVAATEECLDTFAAALEKGQRYLLQAPSLTTLDMHLYAYIAPLLQCQPELPTKVIATTLREKYPALVTHAENVRMQLWPQGMPTFVQARLEPESTPSTSSWWPFSNLFAGSIDTSKASTATPQPTPFAAGGAPKPKPKEDGRLRLGRAIWICTALLGFVGYTIASGIVSVEWVDPDAEEEEDDEEDEDEDEEGEEEPETCASAPTWTLPSSEGACPRYRRIVTGTFNTPSLHLLQYDTLLHTLSLTTSIGAEGPHQYLALGTTSSGALTVYATTWAADKSLSSWRVDGTSLSHINTVPITATGSYVHVQPPPFTSLTSPSYGVEGGVARYLYSAGGPTGEMHTLDPQTGAMLAKRQEYVYLRGGPSALPDADKSRRALRYGTHNVDVSVLGFAYVADLGRNAVLVYSVDADTGELALVDEVASPEEGEGPRHVVPSPDGSRFYSVTEHTSFVDIFKLTERGYVHEERRDILPPGAKRHAYRGDTVRLSPDGQALFATTRGMTDSVQGYVTYWHGDIVKRYQTRNSGGKANAIEWAPRTSSEDLMVLTDDQEGYLTVFTWDGTSLQERSSVKLPGTAEDGTDEGASHAIWLE